MRSLDTRPASFQVANALQECWAATLLLPDGVELDQLFVHAEVHGFRVRGHLEGDEEFRILGLPDGPVVVRASAWSESEKAWQGQTEGSPGDVVRIRLEPR